MCNLVMIFLTLITERVSRNSKSDSTVVFVGEAVTPREVQKVSGGYDHRKQSLCILKHAFEGIFYCFQTE